MICLSDKIKEFLRYEYILIVLKIPPFSSYNKNLLYNRIKFILYENK